MKVGLILAGGMGKGAYQAGALRAIGKYIPYDQIEYISASSVGALNGAFFSCGMIDEAIELWKSVNSVADNIPITDILKSTYLKNAISKVSSNELAAERFFFPLLTIARRVRQIHYFDLKKEPLGERRYDLLRASVAVPVFAKPVTIDGVRYFDGAVVDNIPLTPIKLFTDEIDVFIAIYFDNTQTVFDSPGFKGKTLKICFDDDSRLKNAALLNTKSINEMLEDGERRTELLLERTVRLNENDSAQAIDIENAPKLKGSSKTITSSRALSVLNGITKYIVKYI